jgi:hypothetical protein
MAAPSRVKPSREMEAGTTKLAGPIRRARKRRVRHRASLILDSRDWFSGRVLSRLTPTEQQQFAASDSELSSSRSSTAGPYLAIGRFGCAGDRTATHDAPNQRHSLRERGRHRQDVSGLANSTLFI